MDYLSCQSTKREDLKVKDKLLMFIQETEEALRPNLVMSIFS